MVYAELQLNACETNISGSDYWAHILNFLAYLWVLSYETNSKYDYFDTVRVS